MAVTDTDYSLIMLKLTQFEDKLKKLEQEIEALKCKNAAHKESDLNSYKKEMVKAFYGDPPYALSSGSLVDGGMTQVWHNTQLAKEGQDVEE